jgi:hypothetical protein
MKGLFCCGGKLGSRQRDLSVDVGAVGHRLYELEYIDDGLLEFMYLCPPVCSLSSQSKYNGIRAEHRRSIDGAPSLMTSPEGGKNEESGLV